MRKNLHYLFFIVLFTILFMCAGPVAIVTGSDTGNSLTVFDNGTERQVIVDFFYNPTCESCQKVLPIIQQYEASNPVIRVNYQNIVENQSTVERFIQVQKDLGNLNLHVPVVVIGNQYLNGEKNISGNLDRLVRETIETNNNVTIPGNPLTPPESVSSIDNQGPGVIHFFYNPTCESCQKVLPLIDLNSEKVHTTSIKSYF